jgi:transposase
VNYGLVSAPGGCPVAISVYEGNRADAATLMPQVKRLREQFGIGKLVLVGDRGMVSQSSIDELRELDTVSWITALKSPQIRSLIEQGTVQLGLFDERNLFEFSHPDYPQERLVACRNDQLAKLRTHKREDLLKATAAELDKVRLMVERGDLRGAGHIGLRAGRVVNKYKVAKHFELTIEPQRFAFGILKEQVAQEALLDGIYVLRTAVPAQQMDAPQVVRSYKSLADVERAFRSLKTVDLQVRPIHHRLAERVRSHIFLCMLAYYIEWHMREAWRPILFADEDQQAKATRDAVAPAKRSANAQHKASSHRLPDGTPAHSFRTLIEELASIVRNTCRLPGQPDSASTFQLTTTANPKQQRALELLNTITL